MAVPADPNATFAKAIAESFKMKLEEAEQMKCELCGEMCDSKEMLDKHMLDKHPKVTEPAEEKSKEEKMAEEITETAKVQVEEKTRILEEQNAKMSELLKEYAEKEMTALRETYKNLTSEKGVSVREGYEKLSKEVMEALIDTLKSLKATEVKTEEKKEVTKGGIVTTTQEETKEVICVERAEVGKGFALYAENIGDLHPAYKWR